MSLTRLQCTSLYLDTSRKGHLINAENVIEAQREKKEVTRIYAPVLVLKWYCKTHFCIYLLQIDIYLFIYSFIILVMFSKCFPGPAYCS